MVEVCSSAHTTICNFGTHSVPKTKSGNDILALFAYRPTAEVDTMSSRDLSAEAIAAILFGLLQLGIGFVSLWQQRQLRHAYRTCPIAVS
jgi:hypothetical protein